MPENRLFFEDFQLDIAERRLMRGGETVAVNGRYFDALALLAAEAGRLVTKDRFMEEVWCGAAVTDEALTQCVRSLRRMLGDVAAAPRFIETVPGHGYRFIAPVRKTAPAAPGDATPPEAALGTMAQTVAPARLSISFGRCVPAALGGLAAGLAGGVVYGGIVSAGAADAGAGAVSALLVILAVCGAVGLVAGLGVGLGLAASPIFPGPTIARRLAGGALGGLLVGAVSKLVGVDAFILLFGVGLTGMTGGGEGLLLGAAAGLAAHLAEQGGPRWRRLAGAALAGLAAGLVIHMLGGRLMAGSLALLIEAASGARLDLSALGAVGGEADFGLRARAVTAAFEGALFTGLVAAMLTRRELTRAVESPPATGARPPRDL